ncbi:glycosyltransferase family 4 protein [Pseudomonas syringae group sp. J309-1]|uniref:glycosyltransferase family 4 protein n=1 Tax=Pseudomonas syringae group sp. J309-1 TaxID=3079588 RepID=UPI00290FF933|nr:glycosyltransferase family 4 protein [Pseudomonas syringae group sp. J309-1]MDU8360945.1 glycosyltransferase family 4 protein [Pseudomonas syringae group sp. J309-1]
MRILWTLPYMPWPTTSGGKTREYHLLRNLAARGHQITLLVQSKTDVDQSARDALEPWLERLIVVPRRPLKSLKTLMAIAVAPAPMLACINGYAPRLSEVFEGLLEEHWDVIQLQHTYGFEPLEKPLRRSGKPFVMTEHNVESAMGATSYDRLPRWANLFASYDRWRYRHWESRVFRQADQLIAVTEDDAKEISRLSGKATAVVVNSVDCGYYAQVKPDPYSNRLLFIGNYEYGPNVDAIEWALSEIMPKVWQHAPTLRFVVCGFALPESWRDRWPDPRIEFQGFVPDLRALQNNTAIFFAPLRQGGGSKLKVLEAMAAGLPVVTTDQGSSGLAVVNGEHYLGSEDPLELARIITEAIEQPARLAQIGEAGRKYVQNHHDWSVSAAQLERIYTRLTPAKVKAEQEPRPCV